MNQVRPGPFLLELDRLRGGQLYAWRVFCILLSTALDAIHLVPELRKAVHIPKTSGTLWTTLILPPPCGMSIQQPGKLRAIEAAARGRKTISATNMPQTAKATKSGRL